MVIDVKDEGNFLFELRMAILYWLHNHRLSMGFLSRPHEAPYRTQTFPLLLASAYNMGLIGLLTSLIS